MSCVADPPAAPRGTLPAPRLQTLLAVPRISGDAAALRALEQAQDWVVSREQVLALGFTRHAIAHRMQLRGWRRLLPGVYLCHGGEPSRRQLLVAALLYAGEQAAVDSVDACRFHGVAAAHVDESQVCIVVPWGCPVRSQGFVKVRRTVRPFPTIATDLVRYVDAPTAVVAACRSQSSMRRVTAILSDAVQRGIVTERQLLAAHAAGSPRKAALTGQGLEAVLAGVRSVPENDARLIFQASHALPAPLYNCLLRLPAGRLISPDALIVDAGLVHETNGRRAHARADLFEDMQTRHDVMTAAGLTVLHNSPRRLLRSAPQVLAEMEQCYERLAGRGLPAGVEIVRPAA